MTPKDFLQEYKELIRNTIDAQNKTSNLLDKALGQLDKERQEFEKFNNSSWFTKHKNLVVFCLPLITILVILLGSFIFVSSGHKINLKAGDYEITAE